MKKKNILAVLILLTFFAVVVSFLVDKPQKKIEKKETTLSLIKPRDPESEKYIDTVDNKDYELNVVDLGDKVKRGEGLLFKDGSLYVVDSKNNQLVILDENYELKEKIGKTGNAALEFQHPTGITSDKDGNFYILDSGNKRVQILDSELKFVKEMKFKVMSDDPNEIYEHIGIGKDNNIYLSGEILGSPGIAILNDKGIQSKIDDYFSGSVFSKGGKVYAINFGDMFKEIGYGSQNGRNFLMEIKNEKLNKIAELPYGIGTLSFLINNEGEIIVDSSLFSAATFVGKKGNYLFSLKKYPDIPQQRTSHICSMEDSILISNSINNQLISYTLKR